MLGLALRVLTTHQPNALVEHVCVCAYLQDETLWAGKLVVPHGFVHEQEEQAGQEGQSDEDQTCDLSNHTHKYTFRRHIGTHKKCRCTLYNMVSVVLLSTNSKKGAKSTMC